MELIQTAAETGVVDEDLDFFPFGGQGVYFLLDLFLIADIEFKNN